MKTQSKSQQILKKNYRQVDSCIIWQCRGLTIVKTKVKKKKSKGFTLTDCKMILQSYNN